MKEYHKQWYRANKIRLDIKNTEWAKNNITRKREISLISYYRVTLRKFGLTLEDYYRLKSLGCKICGSIKSSRIDHDHNTNQFRGILCGKCNAGLGWYESKRDKIKEYLNDK